MWDDEGKKEIVIHSRAKKVKLHPVKGYFHVYSRCDKHVIQFWQFLTIKGHVEISVTISCYDGVGICGASSRYPYKVGDHNSPRSKKNRTREAEFQAFHHFFFFGGGGGGGVIGKLYIDLKHRIWRMQICQKRKILFFRHYMAFVVTHHIYTWTHK